MPTIVEKETVKKRKPRQIALIERDPETGEIIKRLVDKKKRVRISALKKAILR